MGVPKFFRWLSERYPCLSQQVSPFQIPEFDNLYLDMNGLIHPCSHPNDGDAHFRISEKEIFTNIFQYIENLFRMIKPRKVFFMAVDGVAPRAKMNQQRGRRFRTARDMSKLEKEALQRGELLPSEKRFDSNCITPGTGFMCRLHEQLKYFVAEKISSDPLWQRVKVILSGHDVPGEGEHKIMEFIRHERTLPGYNIETRHCMYGLDADLIVLGLCTHEPYFSLLREEVKFTKSKSKRPVSSENVNFFLLHLSMLRDYIDHEFCQLRSTLKFDYDLERIIDDWVLMGFLVGNDFIPHLPNLHIKTNALALIYSIYKNVMPSLDGYINNCGTLNLERFETLLKELALWELDRIQDDAADIKWLAGKRKQAAESKPVEVMKDLEMFFNADDAAEAIECISLEPAEKSPFSVIECDAEFELRDSRSGSEASLCTLEYRQIRRHYYSSKLKIDVDDSSALELAVEYVRAIQWILYYYYTGVCSWSWFYPYHYAPMLGDLHRFGSVPGVVDFELGTPFLPYEQLMGVLPQASADCLPECLQSLMLSKSSPLSLFFPETFETDLNGKTQDWEAIVLLPFIDESQLLEAMTPLYSQLSEIETARNKHGGPLEFQYTSRNQGVLLAPDHFPDVAENFCAFCQLSRDQFVVERSEVRHGVLPGVKLEAVRHGFPTLKNIKHTARLEEKGVRVFEQSSRGLNMMLYLENTERTNDLDSIARTLIQRDHVFAQWPFLIQIRVESVSDGKVWLTRAPNSVGSADCVSSSPISENYKTAFVAHRGDIVKQYYFHRGVDLGNVDVLVYGRRLVGCRITRDDSSGKLVADKTWSPVKVAFALQTCLWDVECEDECDADVRCSLAESSLRPGTSCFLMTAKHYGQQAKMVRMMDSGMAEVEPVKTGQPQLPAFTAAIKRMEQLNSQYMPGYIVAKRLGVSSHLVSMLTSCVLLVKKRKSPSASAANKEAVALDELILEPEEKTNIAVDCKHNRKSEQVAGWSWFRDGCWLYSPLVLDTLREYKEQFPELFTYMSNHEGFKVKDTDLWPGSEEFRSDRYKKLSAWIQSLACSREARWLHGSSFLDPGVVACVEEAVDRSSCAEAQATARAKSVMAPLNKLFTPDLVYGNVAPDTSATYQLFDRVVNVRPGNGAPYAASATITGIRPGADDLPSLCDLVFDLPFSGGRQLRCSESRGYQLPTTALINLSHARRLLQGSSPHGVQDRSQQKQQHQQQPHQHQQRHHQQHNDSYQEEQQRFRQQASRQNQRHYQQQQQSRQWQGRQPVVEGLPGFRAGNISHQTPRFPLPFPHVRPMTQSVRPPSSMFGPMVPPGPDIMFKLHRQLMSGPNSYPCGVPPPSGRFSNNSAPPRPLLTQPPPVPPASRTLDGVTLLARSSQHMSKKSPVPSAVLSSSTSSSSPAARSNSQGGAAGDMGSDNITGSVLRLLSAGDASTISQPKPDFSRQAPLKHTNSRTGPTNAQAKVCEGKQEAIEPVTDSASRSVSSGGRVKKSRVFRSSRPGRSRLVASFGAKQHSDNVVPPQKQQQQERSEHEGSRRPRRQ